jgi:hypothetical protein
MRVAAAIREDDEPGRQEGDSGVGNAASTHDFLQGLLVSLSIRQQHAGRIAARLLQDQLLVDGSISSLFEEQERTTIRNHVVEYHQR